MRLEREADNSPTSSAEVKNEWSFASTPLDIYMVCVGKENCNSLTPLLYSSSVCCGGDGLKLKRAAVDLLNYEPWKAN
jgi:hypothetical protein